jgi:hypothetical protein
MLLNPPASSCHELLSEEVWGQIFSYLRPEELQRVSLVCRTWHAYLQNDWIWRQAFHVHFHGKPVRRVDETNWKQEYRKRMMALRVFKKGKYRSREVLSRIGEITMIADQTFQRKLTIGSEETGMITTFDPFNGKMGSNNPHLSENQIDERIVCLTVKPNLYVCGHDQGHVTKTQIMADNCYTTKRFPNRHRKSISKIDTNGVWLVSGDKDGLLMVSGPKEDFCYTLQAHHSTITALYISENGLMASGCINGKVCVWKLEEEHGQLIREWEGPPYPIVRIQLDSHRLSAMISSRDGSLKLWNLARNMCETNFDSSSTLIYCFSWDPDHDFLVLGFGDGAVQLWKGEDGTDYRVLKTLYDGHHGIVTNVYHDAWKIVSLYEDGWIHIWDVVNGERLTSLNFREKLPTKKILTSVDENLGLTIPRQPPFFVSNFRIILAVGSYLCHWDFTPETSRRDPPRKPKSKPGMSKNSSKTCLLDMKEEVQAGRLMIEQDRQMAQTWDRLCMKNNVNGLTEDELVQYATMLSLEHDFHESNWSFESDELSE